MRVLILGGTAEARELADALVDFGHDVTTSLAGRTSDPMLPKGRLRMGKFGGVPGLTAYLHAAGIERLVDATHPYAGLISINAVAGAQAVGIPLIRLMRPAWQMQPGVTWLSVQSIAAAAAVLPSNAEALLTTGHAGLELFMARQDCHFTVRLIEPPEFELPSNAKLVLSRPPYSVEEELALQRREEITHLVTKNSGGAQTTAKLEAARILGVQVIMIDRPTYGPAREVASVAEALSALHSAI